MSTESEVSEPLIRRIKASIYAAKASREAVEFDWPECHRKNCPHGHGNVDSAFGTMMRQIAESVESELRFEMTTRPDIHEDGDTPEQDAIYALAILMNTYNVHHAGTFVKAAQLMVDAYPKLTEAFAPETSPVGFVVVDIKNRKMDWDGEMHPTREAAIESLTDHTWWCRTPEEATDERTFYGDVYEILPVVR